MTNWMTAAGIALIAGGLATLIGFRHALWGGGDDRGRERAQRGPRRKAPAATPPRPPRGARTARAPRGEVPQPRGSRRRRTAVAAGVGAGGRHDRDGGLASLGLADEEPVDEAFAVADEPSGEVLVGDADATGDDVGRRAEDERSGEVVGPDPVAGRSSERNEPGAEMGSGRRVLRAAMAEVQGRADTAGEDPSGGLREDGAEAPVGIRPGDGREAAEGRTGSQPVVVPGAETPVARAAEAADLRAAEMPVGRSVEIPVGRVAEMPGGRAAEMPDGRAAESPDTPVGDVTTAVPRMSRDDAPPRRIAREGDRVDGWVRPDYRDQRDITGDYWTPVPEGEYGDGGYGWPVPVERLPAVPPYPPASGFDLPPVNEPTAVVPQWPPARPSGRIETPRVWRGADEEPRRDAEKDDRSWAERDRQSPPRWPIEPVDPEPRDGGGPRRRQAVTIERPEPADQPAWSRLGQRRRVSPVTEHIPAVADSTQMLPSVDGLVAERGDADRPRSRPRPRPRPQATDKSTVYVSKHAADPT